MIRLVTAQNKNIGDESNNNVAAKGKIANEIKKATDVFSWKRSTSSCNLSIYTPQDARNEAHAGIRRMYF